MTDKDLKAINNLTKELHKLGMTINELNKTIEFFQKNAKKAQKKSIAEKLVPLIAINSQEKLFPL